MCAWVGAHHRQRAWRTLRVEPGSATGPAVPAERYAQRPARTLPAVVRPVPAVLGAPLWTATGSRMMAAHCCARAGSAAPSDHRTTCCLLRNWFR